MCPELGNEEAPWSNSCIHSQSGDIRKNVIISGGNIYSENICLVQIWGIYLSLSSLMVFGRPWFWSQPKPEAVRVGWPAANGVVAYVGTVCGGKIRGDLRQTQIAGWPGYDLGRIFKNVFHTHMSKCMVIQSIRLYVWNNIVANPGGSRQVLRLTQQVGRGNWLGWLKLCLPWQIDKKKP